MKNFKFKDLIFPTIVSFVLSFMLIIYEPIITYAANTDDYWFSFKTLILNNLLLFLMLFFVGVIFSVIVYILALLIKKRSLYNLYLVLLFVAFIATYIQGNFMDGSLPTLDGSPIIWSNYTKLGVISIALWCILLGLSTFLLVKYKEKVFTYMKYISLAVFAMLFVSLGTTLLTSKDIYANKGTFTATVDNINNLSKNKNFLILLTDCVDSRNFKELLKKDNNDEVFKDFTYYPDTLSGYGFTRDSVPFIFSGEWYEAKTTYSEHYQHVITHSKLFDLLKNNNYDINFYDDELWIFNNDTYDFKNVRQISAKASLIPFFRQEAKYILFKYLPFPLKKFSKIETMDYSKCKIELNNGNDSEIYNWSNLKNYDLFDKIQLQNNNYFQFVHIEGGHLPHDLNKNLESINNGTYEDKLEATITIINKYLTRIKESGQYDNTAIIILSDHGFSGYDYTGRQNPILFIKGYNEKHEMQISDKKVSYADLNDIYNDLIDGKKTNQLLSNITKNRIRRYLFYKEYDKMSEQILDGHAWETEKLKDTGKKYGK